MRSNDDESASENGIDAAISAGIALGANDGVELTEGYRAFILPAGATLKEVDLESLMPTPRRKKGASIVATVESFIAFVNAHRVAGTQVFASRGNLRFDAVINGHEAEARTATVTSGARPPDAMLEALQNMAAAMMPARNNEQATAATEPPAAPDGDPDSAKDANPAPAYVGSIKVEYDSRGAPGWCDFKVVYACPLSIEWKRWQSKNDQFIPQAAFIEFIEDNLLDITTPAAGAMLAAVRAFEAKKDVRFSSAIRQENGDVAFSYSEGTEQTPGAGKLTLPSEFVLTIPVFEGGAPYEVTARLRYRIAAAGLTLAYDLVRAHKIVEHAYKSVYDKVVAGLTGGVPVYDV